MSIWVGGTCVNDCSVSPGPRHAGGSRRRCSIDWNRKDLAVCSNLVACDRGYGRSPRRCAHVSQWQHFGCNLVPPPQLAPRLTTQVLFHTFVIVFSLPQVHSTLVCWYKIQTPRTDVSHWLHVWPHPQAAAKNQPADSRRHSNSRRSALAWWCQVCLSDQLELNIVRHSDILFPPSIASQCLSSEQQVRTHLHCPITPPHPTPPPVSPSVYSPPFPQSIRPISPTFQLPTGCGPTKCGARDREVLFWAGLHRPPQLLRAARSLQGANGLCSVQDFASQPSAAFCTATL